MSQIRGMRDRLRETCRLVHFLPLLNSVVAMIGHEHRAVAGDRYRDSLVELPCSRSLLTKGRQECAISCKLLNAIVVEIGDEHAAVCIHCDAGHRGKPAVERTENVAGERSAPFAHKISVARKCLDPVAVTVGHVQSPVGGERDVGGIVELPRPDADLPGFAPLFDEAAICAQMLNALITGQVR